jgi:hypothetical protein
MNHDAVMEMGAQIAAVGQGYLYRVDTVTVVAYKSSLHQDQT